jgi:type II secretory pathway pseudopilin PulG
MKSRTKYYVVAVFTMLLGFVGQTAGPLTATASAATQQKNVIEEVQTFGATYGEWSARWWQWLLSIPAAINPNLDGTGANCAQGQEDDVWFLAGTFGGTVTRTCTIPAGKPIFFPLINTIAFKPAGQETLLDLRRLAADFIDSVTVLQATIDGTAIQNLVNFRVRSPSFTVIAPPGGLVPPGKLSVPGNTDPLVSDGYWLLLSPLPAGPHVIHFHSETSGGFVVDVIYNLTIGP